MRKQDFLMVCWRHYNSPKNREKRSKISSNAANVRWQKHRESLADEPIREDLPEDIYRHTFENLITGEKIVLLFHPGDRLNNFKIDVNGKFWKKCGISEAFGLIRKSCYRISRGS